MHRLQRVVHHLPSTQLPTAFHRSPAALLLPSRCFSSTTSRPSASDPAVPTFSHLLFDHSERVVSITLNRPSVHNAFNEEVIAELTTAFTHPLLMSDTSSPSAPRAVILRSTGPSFSAGADLQWMRRMRGYSKEDNVKDAGALFDMLTAIATCPVPVIARVQGSAYGGGVGLIAACDAAFALSDASFAFTEVKVRPSRAIPFRNRWHRLPSLVAHYPVSRLSFSWVCLPLRSPPSSSTAWAVAPAVGC